MTGLYKKYHITKADGSPCDKDANYFVLRLDKDQHARVAALAYAESVRDENPEFARDIRADVELIDRAHARAFLDMIGDES